MIPTLQILDHIHLEVPDKAAAAAWYRDTLGFEIVKSLQAWDTEGGPLTIARGDIHLALFASDSVETLNALAFRCDGEAFLAWEKYLAGKGLLDRCSNHGLAWSLYFHDPYGHRHEITSYDNDYIAAAKE